jgi:carbon-monoxide dehydrogenase small subunit
MSEHLVTLIVNNQRYELEVGDRPNAVNPAHTLSYTLRETLGLTGTKIGCDKGECGACTVLLEEKPVLSCLTLTIECHEKSITTIEGLEDPQTGALDPVQQSFIDSGAFQCGFCTPGMIMSVKALLGENPSPTDREIGEALSGHYCRCMSHYHVLEAVAGSIPKAGDADEKRK